MTERARLSRPSGEMTMSTAYAHTSLARALQVLRASWGHHWMRGGYTGTRALINALDGAMTPSPADRNTLDALAEIERDQRTHATPDEREWHGAVDTVEQLRGEMLSALTVQERKAVANRLAHAVTRMVCWGADK